MIDVRLEITNGLLGRYPIGPDPQGRPVIGIAIHHTVTEIPAVATRDDEIAHLLAIDADHTARGWGGFGYHLAVMPSGRWYYCGYLRGARAHVASRNHELIGVAFVGNFTGRQPTWEAILAGREAIAFIRATYPGRPVHSHAYWTLPQYPTVCPGDTWSQWRPELEATPAPAPPPGEEHMKLVVLKGDQSLAQYVLGPNGLKTPLIDEAHRAALEAAGVIGPGEYITLPQAHLDAIPEAL